MMYNIDRNYIEESGLQYNNIHKGADLDLAGRDQRKGR